MAHKVNKVKAEKYFEKSSQCLADGNEHAEAGRHAKAEKCYERSQYWLDKANLWAGNGNDE